MEDADGAIIEEKQKERPKAKFPKNVECELRGQRVAVHAGIDVKKHFNGFAMYAYVYTPHEEPSAYVYMYIYALSYIHIYIYRYKHIYTYTYIHIYIHIDITHIHIYTHTQIQSPMRPSL